MERPTPARIGHVLHAELVVADVVQHLEHGAEDVLAPALVESFAPHQTPLNFKNVANPNEQGKCC